MSRTQSPTILLVDDEPDICRNLTDILTDLDYEVDSAFDGLSALERVRTKPYDIAILDLRMPGMDGLTLCREIKKLRPNTVSIVVTAHSGGLTDEEAVDAGALRVLAKPVDFQRLFQVIGDVLDQPLVLVVDDDRDFCANLWDLLRERGYRVGLAHDAKAAAAQIAEQPFSIVLIDMKIPSGDGGEVFRIVRSANPEARTVLITGHRAEMNELVRRVIDEGADAVIYKPFDVPTLVRVLEEFSKKSE